MSGTHRETATVILGPAYDAAYDALIRVVAGPDAPDTQTGETEPPPTSEVVWQPDAAAPSAELQEILQRLDPDTPSTGSDRQGPRVRVFWQAARAAQRYGISIYHKERWVEEISYAAEYGYDTLVLHPLQRQLPSGDNLIIIGAENELPDSSDRGSVPLPRILLDDPRMQLIYDDVFTSSMIIGIADAALEPLFDLSTERSFRIRVEPRSMMELNPADIVFGREYDLRVCFPYWDGAIDKVSYVLEDNRLKIIVKPGDEGLKLRKADVHFTQGIGYARLPEPDIRKLRRRKGRPVQFNVSLPYQEGTVEKVSYMLQGSFLNIIIMATQPIFPQNPDDVSINTTPMQEENA